MGVTSLVAAAAGVLAPTGPDWPRLAIDIITCIFAYLVSRAITCVMANTTRTLAGSEYLVGMNELVQNMM